MEKRAFSFDEKTVGSNMPHIRKAGGMWHACWTERASADVLPHSYRSASMPTFADVCKVTSEWWAEGPRKPCPGARF